MKINNLFKTAFLLLAMIEGVNSAWADNISIPQDMGSYIVIGSATGADGFASYITKNNCEVDKRLGDAGNNKYYTVGSTRSDSKVNISVTASEAGNYAFGFKSGASGCSSVVTVKLTKSGSDTPLYTSEDVTISNDGNWDPNIEHNFYITGIEAADYTLSLEVKSITTGSYAGNFGNFFFHKTNQLAWPTSSSYMELSDGTFKNARDNNDNVINYISRTGGYIDDLLIYNSTAGYYMFHFNIDSYKQASKVTITVTDFATGTQEAQETKVVTGNGDYLQPLTTEISAGLKRVRFDFADNDETSDNDYLFNFRQVYFTSSADYDALPLTGTATLNLNQTGRILNDCSYEDGNSNIGYVKNGSYADNYIVYNSNETAYYTLCAGIPWYKKGGTFTITITDVATNTEEATATSSEITSTGDVEFLISNAISQGLKKIRFNFTKAEESDYLFNLNNVSFSKTAVPMAISAAGWATLFTDCALNFSDVLGLTAYTATCDGSTVTLTPVDDIPANTGVVLKGDKGTYTIPVITSSETAKGDLKGSATTSTAYNTVTGYDLYMLALNGDSEAQFTKVTSGSIAKGKAYLQVAQGGTARALNVVFADETTSISEECRVKSEKFATASVYNLQGQRVNATKNGLYIKNGKKYFVK